MVPALANGVIGAGILDCGVGLGECLDQTQWVLAFLRAMAECCEYDERFEIERQFLRLGCASKA
jgi:hypothetical protein